MCIQWENIKGSTSQYTVSTVAVRHCSPPHCQELSTQQHNVTFQVLLQVIKKMTCDIHLCASRWRGFKVKLKSSTPQSMTSRDSSASCCCYLGAADVSNVDCPNCLHKHSVQILKVCIQAVSSPGLYSAGC